MKKKTSFDKRLAYLAIADFNYLSARILLLFGLAHTGFPKAAEALELLFKLFLLLEAKIARNYDLTDKDLKEYKHKLVTLFDKIESMIPKKFDRSIRKYIIYLQETYHKRYPENWKSFKYEVEISHLDNIYLYFRNSIVSNFPSEEQERIKQFGGFISNGYSEEIKEIINKRTGRSLKDMLLQDNEHIKNYDISFTKL